MGLIIGFSTQIYVSWHSSPLSQNADVRQPKLIFRHRFAPMNHRFHLETMPLHRQIIRD
jgi:hypothetical protein